jgi:hypothetical protein
MLVPKWLLELRSNKNTDYLGAAFENSSLQHPARHQPKESHSLYIQKHCKCVARQSVGLLCVLYA